MPALFVPGSLAFETGAHFTAATITGMTLSALGVWTPGTAQPIYGIIDEIDATNETEEEDIRPLWSMVANTVTTGFGSGVRVTTLRDSLSGQVLTGIFVGYFYFKLIWTQGHETWTGIFRVSGIQNNPRGHGAQRITLMGRPTDPGTPDTAGQVGNLIVTAA